MNPQLNNDVIQVARAEDAEKFVMLRGQTRENAIPKDRLANLGVTAESWAAEIRSGELIGFTATSGDKLLGYCFGNTETGEIVVLAVLPEAEGQGIGRKLLSAVVDSLKVRGHRRLFLGASPDPKTRSHGFYRHLGWRSTGSTDKLCDEVLELVIESRVGGPETTR